MQVSEQLVSIAWQAAGSNILSSVAVASN